MANPCPDPAYDAEQEADRPPPVAAMVNSVPALEARLRRQTARQQVLGELSQRLLESQDPDEVLRWLYPSLAFEGVDGGFAYAPDGDRLRLVFSAHELPAPLFLDYGEGVCGTVAVSKTALQLADIQASSDPRGGLVRGLGAQAYHCEPLIVRGGFAGTLSFLSRDMQRFDDDQVAMFRQAALLVAFARQRSVAECAQIEALAHERRLLREIDHRANNLLAVVQSIVRLTKGDTVEGFAATLTSRIHALGRVNSRLAENRWEGATLRQILDGELAVYDDPSKPRAQMAGPEVMLAATEAQALTMAMHELAINASAYGSLSSAGGALGVDWRGDGAGGIILRWSERATCLGQASREARAGLGSAIIDATVSQQLAGTITRQWRPDGLDVEIAIPAAHIKAVLPPPDLEPQ